MQARKTRSNLQLHAIQQGSPNFFDRGPHKLLHNSSRAGHLTKCDCFAMCYILPNQHVCRSYVIFSLLAKYLCGPGEMASRAGVGPEAVLWSPCNIATDRKHWNSALIMQEIIHRNFGTMVNVCGFFVFTLMTLMIVFTFVTNKTKCESTFCALFFQWTW